MKNNIMKYLQLVLAGLDLAALEVMTKWMNDLDNQSVESKLKKLEEIFSNPPMAKKTPFLEGICFSKNIEIFGQTPK